MAFTGANAEKTYDGTALSDNSYTVTGLPDGFTATAVVEGEQTDAGSSENKVTSWTILDAGGNDVSAWFTNVSVVSGTLTVNPAAITVTTGSASKPYDGTELTSDEVTVEGLVPDETVTVIATGSRTDVGESDNTYTISWGTAKEGNYTVTDSLGTLEVVERDLVVKAASDSKTYDGTLLENADYTSEGLPEGFSLEAVVSGSITDAGEVPNEVGDCFVYNASGEDVTSFFTISKANGTLTVTPAAITVTTGSASKPYDGTELTSDEVTVEGLVPDETVTITATGSRTDVGESDNAYTISWGTAKEGNYTVTDSLGTLEVVERDLVVKAASDSQIYDGTPLTNADYTSEGLPEGFSLEAVVSGTITDAGEAVNEVGDCFVYNASGEDVTSFFTILKAPGVLAVSPAQVSISTAVQEKTYNGTPLVCGEPSVTGVVSPDTLTASVKEGTGSIINVGEVTPEIEYVWGSGVNQDNYEVTVTPGKLTVNPAKVTVKSYNKSSTYSGNPFPVTTEDPPEITGLIGEDASVVTVAEDLTAVDAGEHENTCTVEWGTANRDNYEVATDYGTLTIGKLPVTVYLTSEESGDFYYCPVQPWAMDASAYTDEVSYSEEANIITYEDEVATTGVFSELPGGATLTVVVPAVSAIGPNIYHPSETITGGNPDNYDITYDGLDVYIEPFTVQLTLEAEVPYDGQPHSGAEGELSVYCYFAGYYAGYEFSAEKVSDSPAQWKVTTENGEIEFTVTASGGGTDADTYPLTLTTSIQKAKAGGLVIETNKAELKITRLDVDVTVTGNTLEVDYDSKTHRVDGYNIEISNPLYQNSDIIYSGPSMWVSADSCSTHYMGLYPEYFDNSNPNFNVNFIVKDGYLTIWPAEVTFDFHADGVYIPDGHPKFPGTITGTYADGGAVEGTVNEIYEYEGAEATGITAEFTLRDGKKIVFTCNAYSTTGTYTYPSSVTSYSGNYTIKYENNVMTIPEPGSGHGGS